MGFEIVSDKIATVHMDGSDENMRGIKLFRLGKYPTDQISSSSKYCYTFSNLAGPTRRVAVVLYSTHNGKGGRNQLRASSNIAEDSSNSKKLYAKYFLNNRMHLRGEQSNYSSI